MSVPCHLHTYIFMIVFVISCVICMFLFIYHAVTLFFYIQDCFLLIGTAVREGDFWTTSCDINDKINSIPMQSWEKILYDKKKICTFLSKNERDIIENMDNIWLSTVCCTFIKYIQMWSKIITLWKLLVRNISLTTLSEFILIWQSSCVPALNCCTPN
jgi:hypothetical protein